MTLLIEIATQHDNVAGPIADGLRHVEERFNEQLETPIRPVADLCRYVERYRGKMLRPTMVLTCGMAASGRTEHSGKLQRDLVTIAAVLEMIHLATLVHDDVLDEADIRRGAGTVNHKHGNEVAVILGDYLISRSFHLCSQLDDQSVALRVGEITSIVCEGEMLQLHHRGDFDLSEEIYFDIIERKTAALIGVACEMGARVVGASDAFIRRFYNFGLKLGVAFQIQDDLLDLVGDQQVVGKSLGKDLEKGKLTLPLIHHLAQLDADARTQTIRELRTQDGQTAVDQRLASTGSIDYARASATALVSEAKALLAPVGDTPARSYLLSLADAVVARQL